MTSFSPIQSLPAEVVHLMAAGEVIDSLAAVVRELAENALDAGATRIAVSVWPDQWRVRVADNGCGMELENLQRAALPHTTSKLCNRNDLWQIRSLGFRGQALHSLAQLANLEICSRLNLKNACDRTHQTSQTEPALQTGWQAIYNDRGEPIQIEAAAIAPGTIVTATDLFAIWPLRRQGMPAPAQQLRAIQLVIQQMALCHPTLTWQLQRDDRLWFTISPGETAQQILPQILRQLRFSDLRELQLELNIDGEETADKAAQNISHRDATQTTLNTQHSTLNTQTPPPPISDTLYLLLGLPDRCHRRRPDWVRVAVNGRHVRVPELEQTILKGFQRTLPRDRYPICFLHLTLCPRRIDWNRHPAKAEIYLQQLSALQTNIVQAIEQILRLNPNQLSDAYHTQRLKPLLKTAEAGSRYNSHRSLQPESDHQNEAATEAEMFRSLPLRAIAQVHNLYILVEHPLGLWLVEQHIAHERILYEQLCDSWQLVPLEPPAVLSQLSAEQREQLHRLGLTVDPFGEQLWAVRTAPAKLAERKDCPEALWELSLGGDLQTAQVATACRSAIRNGTSLSLLEMQTLIDRWQQTRNPLTCPHGRPIYLSLQESDLARFFRRHWVIGKSHGI